MWISTDGRTKIVRCNSQYEILTLVDGPYETIWRHSMFVATKNIMVVQSKVPNTKWTKLQAKRRETSVKGDALALMMPVIIGKLTRKEVIYIYEHQARY